MGSAPSGVDAPLNFVELLRVLTQHQVDFILVGGVAANLEGAPVSTFDLDILFHSTDENRQRLLAALQQLDARYFDFAGRDIRPDLPKLVDMKLHRLLTLQGPLDVLGTIGDGLDYGQLVAHTRQHPVEDFQVRTLSLEKIILSKEQADRDKDRAVLPILRRTLALQRSPRPEPQSALEVGDEGSSTE